MEEKPTTPNPAESKEAAEKRMRDQLNKLPPNAANTVEQRDKNLSAHPPNPAPFSTQKTEQEKRDDKTPIMFGKDDPKKFPEKKAPDNTAEANKLAADIERRNEEAAKTAERETADREVRKAERLKAEEAESKELLKDIGDILAEHNGLESNIGLDNPYWGKLNRYRALQVKQN